MPRKSSFKLALLVSTSLLFAFALGYEGYKLGLKQGKQGRIPVHSAHRGFDFATQLPNGMRYMGSGKSNLDLLVLEQGFYEPQTIEVLLRLVEFVKNKKPAASPEKNSHEKNTGRDHQDKFVTYLDVGANVGAHVLALAPFVNNVVAVEPYPPVLRVLERHVKINKLKNVDILPLGFGNKPGKVKFVAPPDSDIGIGTFSTDVFNENPYFKKHHNKTLASSDLYFNVVTGDSVLSGVDVDILKVDIEGYERYALEGLKRILTEQQPFVVMELNRNSDGGFKSKESLFATLPNYTFYEIRSDKTKPCVRGLRYSRLTKRQTQVLAVPTHFDKALGALNAPPDCDVMKRF